MTKAVLAKKPQNDAHQSAFQKLYLVKGGAQFNSDDDFNHPNEISAHTEYSLPKEVTPSFSEMTTSEKSPEHLQAIEDVNQFNTGLIKATELRKRHSKTYKNWDDMKQRCKGDPVTGIPPIALDSSFVKFADFLAFAGPRPSPTWSVDRIDPTGPYSPDNCRWASKKAQSRNRTNTVYLEYKGVRLPLVEWAEKIGEEPGTLRARKTARWTDEEIIECRRTPFDYKPWPIDMREELEMEFQRNGMSGEHRVDFLRRYAKVQLEWISIEAEDVTWPEDFVPSIEEAGKEARLNVRFKKWRTILLEASKGQVYSNSHFSTLQTRTACVG